MASSRKPAPDLLTAASLVLARHLPQGGRLMVGYSGGLDSTVLLHALGSVIRNCEMGRVQNGAQGQASYALCALHVHHGLSPQADAWAGHCQNICAQWGIPLQVRHVRVVRDGQGLEAAARNARYDAFRAMATESAADALLLAHHQDDQAETVLLQAMRGATLKGLAAMPEVRRLQPGTLLLRPFLDMPRSDFLAYARDHGLNWVEDESNADTGLARNRVRRVELPVLQAKWPELPEGLGRIARQCSEAAGLLDDLARVDAAAVFAHGALSVPALCSLDAPRARNLLRWAVEEAGGRVRQAAVFEALRQIQSAGRQARVQVDFGNVSVVREGERAWVVARDALKAPPTLDLHWAGQSELTLGPGGGLGFTPSLPGQLVQNAPQVRVRYRQAGDQLAMPSGVRRPLKDVLREQGIPAWRRPWLPVLEVDGQVEWVAEAFEPPVSPVPGWTISWAPPW